MDDEKQEVKDENEYWKAYAAEKEKAMKGPNRREHKNVKRPMTAKQRARKK